MSVHGAVVVLEQYHRVVVSVNLGLHQCDKVVVEETKPVVQPAVAHHRRPLSLRLLLPLVADAPQSVAHVVHSLVEVRSHLAVRAQLIGHHVVVLQFHRCTIIIVIIMFVY